MDPWKDVALSLDPTTRDRHAYAMSNPISNVDLNGHTGCSTQKTCEEYNDYVCEAYGQCEAAKPDTKPNSRPITGDGPSPSGGGTRTGTCGMMCAPTVTVLPTSVTSQGTVYVNPTLLPPRQLQGNWLARTIQWGTGTDYSDNDDFWSSSADGARVMGTILTLGSGRAVVGSTASSARTAGRTALGTTESAGKRTVAIGGGAERVPGIARANGWGYYTGAPGYTKVRNLLGERAASRYGLTHNYVWLRGQMLAGKEVVFVGGGSKFGPSLRMELDTLQRFGYQTTNVIYP